MRSEGPEEMWDLLQLGLKHSKRALALNLKGCPEAPRRSGPIAPGGAPAGCVGRIVVPDTRSEAISEEADGSHGNLT